MLIVPDRPHRTRWVTLVAIQDRLRPFSCALPYATFVESTRPEARAMASAETPVEDLTPAQIQTLPARRALLSKFDSPEAQSAHFRKLAKRSNASRIRITDDERADVARVLDILIRIFHANPGNEK